MSRHADGYHDEQVVLHPLDDGQLVVVNHLRVGERTHILVIILDRTPHVSLVNLTLQPAIVLSPRAVIAGEDRFHHRHRAVPLPLLSIVPLLDGVVTVHLAVGYHCVVSCPGAFFDLLFIFHVIMRTLPFVCSGSRQSYTVR